MPSEKFIIRWPALALVVAVVTGLFFLGLHRIKLDTDIVSSLPQDDPVMRDAAYVLKHHPMQDQVVVDVGSPTASTDALVDAAVCVQERMLASGLFAGTTMKDAQSVFPELLTNITERLHLLFTAEELEKNVAPLLDRRTLGPLLAENIAGLYGLEGIGQARLITRDPLGLRLPVLARLSHLAPSNTMRFYRGQVVSGDGRHVLLVARPKTSGTDTVFARGATALFEKIGRSLNERSGRNDASFTLTTVGAFRAALDNEDLARRDTQMAVILSTIGIMLLLLVAFPRPLVGLLSLFPALAGTIIALVVYSFFHRSISLLTLGFGGAIISITIDSGITYLLFLDRPFETRGKTASREVWAIGLFATLPNIFAFLTLYISGFNILIELGEFAALGLAFSFLFVHLVFPVVFPVVPPARKSGTLPLNRFTGWLARAGGMYKAVAALLLMGALAFFAKPVFNIDLAAMNTVSKETIEAERRVASVWGNVMNKVFLMQEGPSVEALQAAGDDLAARLDREVRNGSLSSAFVPSMLFPGEARLRENREAWMRFWTKERRAQVRSALKRAAGELGVSMDAFKDFTASLERPALAAAQPPESLYPLLGMAKAREGKGMVVFSTLTPGTGYSGEDFYRRFTAGGATRVFDGKLFAGRLGNLLSTAFMRMLVIIGCSVALLMFIFFFDWQLTLLALLPITFAFICTLGTLHLIGHPLDIPALMLSIIILGMGIDYSVFLVRSYQRYTSADRQSLGIITTAIFMNSGATLIGFGVLALADHSLLRSAGLCCFLGIGYSLVGAFALLPPFLERIFRPVPAPPGVPATGSAEHRRRIIARCRHMEAYPRLFIRFKMLFDPLFTELHLHAREPRVLLDIGTGYGAPLLWLLEVHPGLTAYGVEPDPERVRIAARLVGDRGVVAAGAAPDLPAFPEKADTVLMIDMAHHLDDAGLAALARELHGIMRPRGRIILRATIPVPGRMTFLRLIETCQSLLRGSRPRYRSEAELAGIIAGGGFALEAVSPSGDGREEVWFIFTRRK